MEFMAFLSNLVTLISEACVNAEKLPAALISCGVVQAAAALALAIFEAPGGIFLNHGKAPIYLYYGILISVVIFGLVEASAGFWVSAPVPLPDPGLHSLVPCCPLLVLAHSPHSQELRLADLMEAIENSMVEGAILWLAQTILESLFISGKLHEWIRQVGLADAIERLRFEIERIETVVAAVKGRAAGNKPLARSLARLRELMYDADDLVDELDYFRLQQQVEGGSTACANNEAEGMDLDGAEIAVVGTSDNPNIPSTSKKRKNRCNYWDNFFEKRDDKGNISGAICRCCHALIKCGGNTGTNGLKKHLKNGKCLGTRPTVDRPPTPTSDGAPNGTSDATLDSVIRKRIGIDEASTLNISRHGNTCHWNTADSCKRIHQITLELKGLRGDVTELLKDSVAPSGQYQSNTSDTQIRTTSLVPRKVYGRDAEKDYIIRVLTAAESDVIAVLPIVGIAGVGKTALAQLVYNDPEVESQFNRIWVCVSYNFNEVTLTREMFNLFPQETKEGNPKIQYRRETISGLGKLQEILEAHVQCHSLAKKKDKGNVILITTRDLSVAQRIGTEEPIKLGALEMDDFWSLYKSFALRDDNYVLHPSLNMIGAEIHKKLKGNPLALETAGQILRKPLNIEHWSSILKNEDWKSLQLRGGIMAALKLSYDQLPYNLQQCFLYCTIFPNNYKFLDKDLVRAWISLGFVTCTSSGKKLEETGHDYLNNLVNLCFFEQAVARRKTCYVICGIMHDFGRLVSKTVFTTIDSLEFNKILPTIRHLSIVTDSAYSCDQEGTILRSEKFEKNVQSIFESAGQLRMLVLLGKYDTVFFGSFQNMLQKAQNLRLLQISAAEHTFYSFQGSLVSPVHLRHLKLEFREVFSDLPRALSKWYHVQVLDLGNSRTILTSLIGMDNLVSLRHLVASESVYFSSIGNVTSLQELICAGSDITKLQSMSELVQLGVYKLGNVTTRDVACGASLKDKQNLEKLHLSWKDNLPPDEYHFPLVTDCNNSPSSTHFADTASDVLEGLEPHNNLKYLQISGYSGATSPAWLASSVTSLRALHLDDCGEWQILPSLENLPFLITLKLTNMKKIIKVSIPSLEELVLVNLPKLELCSCNSVMDLSSSLRVLKISKCNELKSFPLFESCEKFNIEQKSCFCRLDILTIHHCSQLKISNHLPPSSTVSELSIRAVSDVPNMEGSPVEYLKIVSRTSEVTMLDDKRFAYHNLRMLTNLTIYNQTRVYISFQGFRQLINLKYLTLDLCDEIFSDENMAAANDSALPSLRRLEVRICGILGKWLSVLLRHVKAVEKFCLYDCQQITVLSIEEEESNLSDLPSGPEASSSGNSYNNALAVPPSDGLLRMPSNLLSSVKKMSISECDELIYQGSKVGFARFASLEGLDICGCPKLIPSLVHSGANNDPANGRWLLPLSLCSILIDESPETLQLCFPENRSYLRKLQVKNSPRLKSLQLHSCTTLEELAINNCESLAALEGLQSLGGLRVLKVSSCPGLPLLLEHLPRQGY
ncbi:hypothetical protein EJB05_38284, partial [Eragrostis curvula]